jgi:hypothetical protein
VNDSSIAEIIFLEQSGIGRAFNLDEIIAYPALRTYIDDKIIIRRLMMRSIFDVFSVAKLAIVSTIKNLATVCFFCLHSFFL